MSRSEIKRAIARQATAAADEVAAVRTARDAGTLTRDGFERHLRSYILFKYRLEPEEATDAQGRAEDGLEALAQLSLDKALRKAPDRAVSETMSATCDGADSVTTKQALLIMAIQRDFDIVVDGFAVAFVDTVRGLAELVWDCYGGDSR